MSDSAALVALIRDAFAGTCLGDGISAEESHLLDNCEFSSDDRHPPLQCPSRSQSWERLLTDNKKELDRVMLSFVNPESVRYYLPALLSRDLQDYGWLSNSFFLTVKRGSLHKSSLENWSALTSAQLYAISCVVRFFAQRESDDDFRSRRAWSRYWRDVWHGRHPDVPIEPTLEPEVSNQEILESAISSAFNGVCREGGISWAELIRRSEGVNPEYDRWLDELDDPGNDWSALIDLETWPSNHYFIDPKHLDPQAFRYYLPALLVRELAGDSSYFLSFVLDIGRHSDRKSFLSLLNSEQLEVVRECVEFLILNDFPSPWQRIYLSYWKDM